MNYVELLTKEEKSTLCKIITGKEFKELFKRNEQEFSKIRKGFRAKNLTEEFALSNALTNIDKPFIAKFVNTIVENWLKDIQENIVRLEGEGLSHNAALAETMLDSFFANNIELYFKLTGHSLDMDACSVFYERMENIKFERVKDAETADRIKNMEEENRRLSDQVETVQNTIKVECDEKIRVIEQDKDKLESLLAEARVKISELQTQIDNLQNNDADYLAEFDDTNASVLPSADTDEIISLFGVILDRKGQKWLKRYADLDSKGRYCIFHRNEDISPYFENRDRIFHMNGPSDEGFYGVWNWSVSPDRKDSSRDHVSSKHNTNIIPIEVVIISNANIFKDMIDALKRGVECSLHSNRVMFAYRNFKGYYTGVLCSAKDLKITEGKAAFDENCNEVPVYEFDAGNILDLDNKLAFYRKAFAGIPERILKLKSPNEIAKAAILSSISWPIYKEIGAIRAEYKALKELIGAVPADTITLKIKTACRCSDSEAKKYLDSFLSTAYKYIDGDSLEDKIVRSAILGDAKLHEKAKKLVCEDWKKENENLLTEATQNLDVLQEELNSAAEDLKKKQEVLNETKEEIERLSENIAEKEKLAENVEKAVEERIRKARENAADFIASMAFAGSSACASAEDTAAYCVSPEFENLNELVAHHSWEEVIGTAVDELEAAGVAKQYRSGLAAFLCAAYIEKQPLLLIGPNAIDIIQAFSAAVTAHKHGILCCEGGYVRKTIEKIGADGEDIVIINNLLASGWINRLPEILSEKDIFYVATHPYAEDVQVEPKSLYGFMLPLFTEFLVDKKATGKYYGGYFADDFECLSEEDTHERITALSKFTPSTLVRNQINSLAAIMHSIYPSATADDDFLFCTFPIAYASMAINELTEAIADPQKGITISNDLKRNLRYVLGEN